MYGEPDKKAVDWRGRLIEAESRQRIERMSRPWWRRMRLELAVTLWTSWAILAAAILAAVALILAAQHYAAEQRLAADQVVRDNLELRRQVRDLLCRTWPGECLNPAGPERRRAQP